MQRLSFHRPRKSCGGFSLVEVAISLAITGFAMLSILGLVPMGLTNFRQAMNNTVESQIVQSITSELQLTSFSTLSTATAAVTYYDADGNSLPATQSAQAIYVATATPVAFSVSGSSYPIDLTGQAYNVRIVISNNTQKSQKAHTYAIIVANQNN